MQLIMADHIQSNISLILNPTQNGDSVLAFNILCLYEHRIKRYDKTTLEKNELILFYIL